MNDPSNHWILELSWREATCGLKQNIKSKPSAWGASAATGFFKSKSNHICTQDQNEDCREKCVAKICTLQAIRG